MWENGFKEARDFECFPYCSSILVFAALRLRYYIDEPSYEKALQLTIILETVVCDVLQIKQSFSRKISIVGIYYRLLSRQRRYCAGN